jgi:hypothetical protein
LPILIMKNPLLIILCFFTAVGFYSHGATVNVGLGESIQAAIDNASAGDTVRLVAPGEYSGDINVTKAIRLISVQRNYNNIGGVITVKDISSGETVRFKNLSISTNLNVIGSSLDLVRCEINEINATNPGGADCRLTVLQSNVSSKLSSTLPSTWVGYSDLRENYFEGKIELVGNDIDGEEMSGIGVDLYGENTTANVHNNLIHHFKGTSGNESCIGIRIDGNASATIRNNNINDNWRSSRAYNRYYQTGIGVLVKSAQSVLIEANIFWNNGVSWGYEAEAYEGEKGSLNIYAGSEGVSVTRNALESGAEHVPSTRPLGVFGVTPFECITSAPQNDTEFLSSTTALVLNGEGQDAGPPDPIHFDHDGSRNDIGPNGGRNYIPDGRTTNKPIPIVFTVEPQIVPINGSVTIESTGVIVK